jgi:hypothetical protein
MGMVNVKLVCETLDDQPWLVIRQDWTGTMEFSNIKCTCLGPSRSMCYLQEEEDERRFNKEESSCMEKGRDSVAT